MRISDWSSDVCSSDLLQGFLVSFQFMLVHETAHRTAFRSRWPNLLFGHLSGAAIILPYEYYTQFHWDHHRYTQDAAKDPELVFRDPPRSLPMLIFAFSGITQVFKRLALIMRHAITGRVTVTRPEERRVGKEGGRTCRSRGTP